MERTAPDHTPKRINRIRQIKRAEQIFNWRPKRGENNVTRDSSNQQQQQQQRRRRKIVDYNRHRIANQRTSICPSICANTYSSHFQFGGVVSEYWIGTKTHVGLVVAPPVSSWSTDKKFLRHTADGVWSLMGIARIVSIRLRCYVGAWEQRRLNTSTNMCSRYLEVTKVVGGQPSTHMPTFLLIT